MSGGNAKDRVRHTYNGLGQLTGQQQMHNGTSGPSVGYAYSEMADGANHSRLISMTYPNGRESQTWREHSPWTRCQLCHNTRRQGSGKPEGGFSQPRT